MAGAPLPAVPLRSRHSWSRPPAPATRIATTATPATVWKPATSPPADGAEVVVLDDGFQHRRIHRDLDILLGRPSDISSRGVSSLLPSGPLRESGCAASRADLIGGFRDDWKGVAVRPDFTFGHTPTGLVTPNGAIHSLEERRGDPVYLLAGIAGPLRFYDTVERAGFEIVGTSFFADHHPYRDAELQSVVSRAFSKGARAILTTEKDLSRLGPVCTKLSIFALRISVTITEGDPLIEEKLSQIL